MSAGGVGAWSAGVALVALVVAGAAQADPALRIEEVVGELGQEDALGWHRAWRGDRLTARGLRVSRGGRARVRVGEASLTLGGGARVEWRGSRARLLRGCVRVQASAEQPLEIETEAGPLWVRGEASIAETASGTLICVAKGRLGWAGRELTPGTSLLLQGELATAARAELTLPPLRAAAARPPASLRLLDALGRAGQPLALSSLRGRVEVHEAAALTELELTFRHEGEQAAEGILYLPIPPDAAVSRLALSEGQELVEGALTLREEAESEDASYLGRLDAPEQAGFTLRIPRIPARGRKRIVIRYSQPLRTRRGARRYAFPLTRYAPGALELEAFDLEALVRAPAAAIETGGEVAPVGSSARVRARLGQDLELVVRAPLPRLDVRAQGREEGFFLVRARPQVLSERLGPRDWVFLCETSASSAGRGYARAFETLAAELDPGDRFALVAYDLSPRALTPGFVRGPGAVAEALAALEAMAPRGACDPVSACRAAGALLSARSTPQRAEVVLLGGGRSTWGERDPAPARAALRGARVSSLSLGGAPGEERPSPLARALTTPSGGLLRLAPRGVEPVAAAFDLALDLASPLARVEVRFPEAESRRVFGVIPAGPQVIAAGEELWVLGRSVELDALVFEVAGEVEPLQGSGPSGSRVEPSLPRLWAKAAIDAFGGDARTHTLERIDQSYGILSPDLTYSLAESCAAAVDPSSLGGPQRLWTSSLEAAPLSAQGTVAGTTDSPLTGGLLRQAANSESGARELATGWAGLALEVHYRSERAQQDEPQPPLPPARAPSARLRRALVGPLPAEVQARSSRVPWGARLDSPDARQAAQSALWGLKRGAWRPAPDLDHVLPTSTGCPTYVTFSYRREAQGPDGSWGSPPLEATCLLTLGLFASGHSHRYGVFKRECRRALTWLEAQVQADGRCGADAYEQALATLTFAELLAVSHDAIRLRARVEKLRDRLLALQRSGGWGGATEREGAPLATFVAVLALKACQSAGLEVPPGALARAKGYLRALLGEEGAAGLTEAAAPGEVHLLHTAGAALCLIFCGERADAPPIQRALRRLEDHLSLGTRAEDYFKQMPRDGMFTLYFATYAMFQGGGAAWRRWQTWLQDVLVPNLVKGGPNDGSWSPRGVWVRGRAPGPSLRGAQAEAALSESLSGLGPSPSAAELTPFARALARVDGATSLDGLRARAPLAARGLLDFRRALLLEHTGDLPAAAALLEAAWSEQGRPEELLAGAVNLRLAAGQRERAWALVASAPLQPGELPLARRLHLARPLLEGRSPEQLRSSLAQASPLLRLALARALPLEERAQRAALVTEAYREAQRPERMLREVVGLWDWAERPAEGTRLLQEAVAKGHRAPWALLALGERERLGSAERLRALTSALDRPLVGGGVRIAVWRALEADWPGPARQALLGELLRAEGAGRDPRGAVLALLERALPEPPALDSHAEAAGELLTWARAQPRLTFDPAQARRLEGLVAGRPSLAAQAAELTLCEVEVQLEWSGQADLDLRVIEPEGGECSSGAPATPAGGALGRESGALRYSRRVAAPGDYRVVVARGEAGGQVALEVRLVTRRGLEVRSRKWLVRLDGPAERVEIGTFRFPREGE